MPINSAYHNIKFTQGIRPYIGTSDHKAGHTTPYFVAKLSEKLNLQPKPVFFF